MELPLKPSAGTCDRCGINRWKRHRHHTLPLSLGGSDDPENIEFICANCHEDAHHPQGEHGVIRTAHTPQARAKRKASMERRWQDPEYRARSEKARTTQVRANGMTPEQVRERDERVLALLNSGKTQREVSREVGLSQPTVSFIARGRLRPSRARGVALREAADARNAARNERVIALRKEGASYDAIAAEVGIAKPTVAKLVKRLAPDLAGRAIGM